MATQIKKSERLEKLDAFLNEIQAIELSYAKDGNLKIWVYSSSKFGKHKIFIITILPTDSWDIFIPACETIRTQEAFHSLISYLKK